MRWPSPPESVAALRAERQVADADVVQEAQAIAISFRMRPAMIDSRSVNWSAPKTASASAIGSFTYSDGLRPFTRTARLSGLRRSPWHPGQSLSAR